MTEQELFNYVKGQKENDKNYSQIARQLAKTTVLPRMIIRGNPEISYKWDAQTLSKFMISKGFRVMPFTKRKHELKVKKQVTVRKEKPQKQDDLFLKIASSSQFSVEEKQKLLRLML